MAEQLSMDELFPQTKGQEINQIPVSDVGPNPSAPPAVSTTAETPASAPAVETPAPWREQMDGLKQMLSLVVQSQMRQPQQPQYQPPQSHEPQEDPYAFKPKQFVTDEDTNLILTSGKPQEHLNRTFNKVAQEVYTPLVQELKKRDEQISYFTQQQAMRDAAIAQAAKAQENQAKFFQSHPDVAKLAYLVPMEANYLAQELQQNGRGFGMDEKATHALLAQRVRERAQMIAQAANPQEGEEPIKQTAAPKAPSTYMERSGGVRPGQAKLPSDPSKAELFRMSNYLKNGKRSVA